MSHAISRSLLPVVVVSLMLATAACRSDTPPSPAVVREVARPTPVGPTPSIAIVPDPTPVASPSSPVVGPGFWTTTGSMTHGHSYGATVTVLQDGRVLVAGGEAASGLISAAADLYDPTTDRWAATGKLHSPRRGVYQKPPEKTVSAFSAQPIGNAENAESTQPFDGVEDIGNLWNKDEISDDGNEDGDFGADEDRYLRALDD